MHENKPEVKVDFSDKLDLIQNRLDAGHVFNYSVHGVINESLGENKYTLNDIVKLLKEIIEKYPDKFNKSFLEKTGNDIDYVIKVLEFAMKKVELTKESEQDYTRTTTLSIIMRLLKNEHDLVSFAEEVFHGKYKEIFAQKNLAGALTYLIRRAGREIYKGKNPILLKNFVNKEVQNHFENDRKGLLLVNLFIFNLVTGNTQNRKQIIQKILAKPDLSILSMKRFLAFWICYENEVKGGIERDSELDSILKNMRNNPELNKIVRNSMKKAKQMNFRDIFKSWANEIDEDLKYKKYSNPNQIYILGAEPINNHAKKDIK